MTEMPEEIWVDSCDWFYIKPLLGRTTCSYRLKSTVDADIAEAEAKIIELWDADISDHNKTIRELTEAARAFQELNCCFRLGKQPSEALFNRLKKAKQALSTRITEAQEDKT